MLRKISDRAKRKSKSLDEATIAKIHFVEAQKLVENYQYDAALDKIDVAILVQPLNAEYKNYKGIICYILGDYERAVSCLTDEFVPPFHHRWMGFKYYLALTWLTGFRNHEKCVNTLREIRHADPLTPKDPLIYPQAMKYLEDLERDMHWQDSELEGVPEVRVEDEESTTAEASTQTDISFLTP